MTRSQREILKFSLQIIFLTLFIYTGASQRSYHMSQNIYEGNKNSCLLSHPHVCCFYITVTVTRCGRGGGLSSTDPPLLRSDTPSPAPPGHPPSTLRSYPPNLSWTSAVQCTVYIHYARLYNVHMGSRSDLSASNYDNNKCTLFMGNYRNDGPLMLPYISWQDLPLFAGPRIMCAFFLR